MLDGYQSIFATSLSCNRCIMMYIYTEFSRDYFAVRKIEKKTTFSVIAIDQAHKQNIAVIKSDRGAIGLTEALSLSFSTNTS